MFIFMNIRRNRKIHSVHNIQYYCSRNYTQ